MHVFSTMLDVSKELSDSVSAVKPTIQGTMM